MDESAKRNRCLSRSQPYFSRKGDGLGTRFGGSVMGSSRSPSLLSRQTVVPLDRARHPEPCVLGCLFGSLPIGARPIPSLRRCSTDRFCSMSDISLQIALSFPCSGLDQIWDLLLSAGTNYHHRWIHHHPRHFRSSLYGSGTTRLISGRAHAHRRSRAGPPVSSCCR
jgi:hypothetical protein